MTPKFPLLLPNARLFCPHSEPCTHSFTENLPPSHHESVTPVTPRQPLPAFDLESKDSGAKRKRRKEIILSLPKENNPAKILNEIMIHALVLRVEEWAGVYKHQEDPRKAEQRIYDPSPPTERWEAEVTSLGICRLANWYMQQPIGNPILNKVEAESQYPRLSSDCYMCVMAHISACMQNVCVYTHSKVGKSVYFL